MGEQTFVVGQRVRVTAEQQRLIRMNDLFEGDMPLFEASKWSGLVYSIDEFPYGGRYGVEFAPGQRVYFDADELEPADAPPAQPVAEWQDISGNDHALSQADAEHQPVLVSTPPAQPDDDRRE